MSLTAGPNLTTPRVIAQDGKDSRRVIVSRPAHLAIVDVESAASDRF